MLGVAEVDVTFCIYQSMFSSRDADEALRVIFLDVRDRGIDAHEISEWNKTVAPFKHLHNAPEIVFFSDAIARRINVPGELCDPQIVFHLPDRASREAKPWHHVDVPPAGKQYTAIFGIALTEWSAENGGLHIWTDESDESKVDCQDLFPGDVVAMSPDQKHSPGINRSGLPRIGLYFRWAEKLPE